MKKIIPFRRDTWGWDRGFRFRIMQRRKWGNTYVYKLRFMGDGLEWWYEYKEHSKLVEDKCMQYNRAGEFIGTEWP